jgi:hypothetical protein
MGACVDFIAFRSAPDEQRLASVRGLAAFRLFKHKVRPEWYLEDVGDHDAISFFGPLRYSPSGEIAKRAKAGAKSFYETLKRARLESWGLDDKRIVQGLAVSCELELPTLLIYGNSSAGVDVGLVCDGGAVRYAKLSALPTGVLVFEDEVARIEKPQTEEFDDEGEPILDLFQFATEVANRFFGDNKRWRVTPDAEDAQDYALLLEKRRR